MKSNKLRKLRIYLRLKRAMVFMMLGVLFLSWIPLIIVQLFGHTIDVYGKDFYTIAIIYFTIGLFIADTEFMDNADNEH